MNLIFIHGWSVTHTNTYGDLPKALAKNAKSYGLDINIQHVHLGKYISFHDEVTLDDIVRALDAALKDLPGNEKSIKKFSCITHSTGGPIVRHWIEKYYGSRELKSLPLKHLVMLAPANHGSALAVLGKQRVGQLKAWFSGVEPGQRVLDWLSLGSEGQWSLAEETLKYNPAKNDYFPFVLTGQGIDRAFYDFINSYLVENGSDGVVRVAGANMNFRRICLEQETTKGELKIITNRKSPKTPIGVFSGFSHSDRKMGIMKSVTMQNSSNHAVLHQILQCLQVGTAADYKKREKDLADLTNIEQLSVPKGKNEKISRYAMLVFNVRDHTGEVLTRDNFDLIFLGGREYRPDQMPKGFVVDKQINAKTHNLVFYVDADKLQTVKDGCLGLRVTGRPNKGFSYYRQALFHANKSTMQKLLSPNQTTYFDIVLHRFVDQSVFRFRAAKSDHENFKKVKPSGKTLD